MTRPARPRVGLAAIAREAGVSVGTVSNVLNSPDRVAEATRGRVLEAIQSLDFIPNGAAAAMRRGVNRLIGLVVPDITNPFYSAIARGVSEAADDAGYGVVLCDSHDDPARELQHMERLAEHRAAGALVAPLTADKNRLARLRAKGAHLVLIDRADPTEVGCSVSMDDVRGGALALSHLLDTRDGDLLLVNGPHSIPQCAHRAEGALLAVRDRGEDESRLQEIVVDEMTSEAGYAAATKLVDSGQIPAGIFCTNDQLAVGVIQALIGRSIDVPGDVAVVGYGDLDIAASAPVPLTSIDQPKLALGKAAVAAALLEATESAEAHRHSSHVFEPRLVLRRSSAEISRTPG
ncbi:LacI family DNA-binding transcriptional regulator [Brachybacterium alimentarium]|uniref:LacI family DNA-binding transcriptional regulator n=1 Tax=Brachybacterium alimentarium TaxID=47845 RepID=UPI003FD2B55A